MPVRSSSVALVISPGPATSSVHDTTRAHRDVGQDGVGVPAKISPTPIRLT